MLEEEYKYYTENKKLLLKKYRNKFIVIKNKNVIGVYGSEKEAFEKTVDDHKLGTFLIQQCVDNEKKLTQTFHTRVIF